MYVKEHEPAIYSIEACVIAMIVIKYIGTVIINLYLIEKQWISLQRAVLSGWTKRCFCKVLSLYEINYSSSNLITVIRL